MISIMRTDRPHPCQRRRLGRHGAALVLLIAAGTGAFAQAARDAVGFPDVARAPRHGLGPFHNPLGYWNTQFHHGTYLQTSISRPGIHEHEHEDGALPTHLAGALWEGAYARDGAEWRYAAALGAGPELHGTLDPVNIFSPGAGRHRLSATARLAHGPRRPPPGGGRLFIG